MKGVIRRRSGSYGTGTLSLIQWKMVSQKSVQKLCVYLHQSSRLGR